MVPEEYKASRSAMSSQGVLAFSVDGMEPPFDLGPKKWDQAAQKSLGL